MRVRHLASGLMAAALLLGMAGIHPTPAVHADPEPVLSDVSLAVFPPDGLYYLQTQAGLAPGSALLAWVSGTGVGHGKGNVTWEWFCGEQSLWSGPGGASEGGQESIIIIPTQAVGCVMSAVATLVDAGVEHSSRSEGLLVRPIEVRPPDGEVLPPEWTIPGRTALVVGYDQASVPERVVTFKNWGSDPVSLNCALEPDNERIGVEIIGGTSLSVGPGESAAMKVRPVAALPQGYYPTIIRCSDDAGGVYLAKANVEVYDPPYVFPAGTSGELWPGMTVDADAKVAPNNAEILYTWMCDGPDGYVVAANNTGGDTYNVTVDDIGCYLYVSLTAHASGQSATERVRKGEVKAIKAEPFDITPRPWELGEEEDVRTVAFTNLSEVALDVEFECRMNEGECDLPQTTRLAPGEVATGVVRFNPGLPIAAHSGSVFVKYTYHGEEDYAFASIGYTVRHPLANMDWWPTSGTPAPEDPKGVDEKPSEGMVLEPWMIQAAIAVAAALTAAIILLVILLGRSRKKARKN